MAFQRERVRTEIPRLKIFAGFQVLEVVTKTT
jgi:hypothetical protein